MDTKKLEAVARSIRSLSMDAVQNAKSGHPGLPLGCAELGAVLFGEAMKHNPSDPQWADRDRFVLSAGHGSMLLYSLLHLSGYNITLDDIKQFRHIGSLCPGHPEYGLTPGVEATTGPLGQGIAMAVGMAAAETMLAARFNTAEHRIVDHYTWVLAGEGCLMEGVSSEASSLAGHLRLGKLIVFYDKNNITIDGSSDVTFTEDIAARYRAYGWQVLEGSVYDMPCLISLIEQAKADAQRPSLIILKSIIGKSSGKEGTAAVHGAPLGEEDVAAAKKRLGLSPDKFFQVDAAAYEYFESRRAVFAEYESDWNKRFSAWSAANPALRAEWDAVMNAEPDGEKPLPEYNPGDVVSTRKASGAALRVMAERYSCLVGGSADLEGSNLTSLAGIPHGDIYTPENRRGRTIRFGIREFAMTDFVSGLLLHGGFRAFCATFMVFCDYMRPAVRLASLMKLPAVYVLTHDSIYVGEDGPTHQPVEMLNSLRGIPGVQVLRPGDAQETCIAWEMAMESADHPVVLALTRQNVTVYEKDDPDWMHTIRCGAYIVQKGGDSPDITILATGSEVELALKASRIAGRKNIRIVSVLDRELFISQPETFRNLIIGNARRIVAAEAGTHSGWEFFAADKRDLFCIDRFGLSGEKSDVAEALGFTAEKLAELLLAQ
ncbi:MAG: transketolase [Bacteroides sp.]|nr:transketolase [Prevotella sp.]MCM1407510.1 transketolase [Treponema brennaborense]MCM1470000.1 transketolase [Bacteroides sp.]